MIRKENDAWGLNMTHVLSTIINLYYFCCGSAMFIIGIIYLTVSFQYSFTAFNSNTVACIFVPFGIVIAFFSMLNVVFVQFLKIKTTQTKYPDESGKFLSSFRMVIASFYGFMLLLFVVLLGIGIWGLSVYSDQKSLTMEIRINMMSATRNYNNNDDKTDGMDWVQRTFDCCGIDGYSDWNYYLNNYGFNPPRVSFSPLGSYQCFIPSSCCINETPNCLIGYFKTCQEYFNKGAKDVNTNGCLLPFLAQLNKDILFLAAFTTSISSLAILVSIINIVAFILCGRRSLNAY